MKKPILIALAAVVMAVIILAMINGCLRTRDPLSGQYYNIIIVDSCEYLQGSNFSIQGHKGNCRFCAERRKAEIREIINELKK